MSIFISFSSKDRKYVSEFLLEAKNQKTPVWAALRREAKTGTDFVKLISRKIEKSSGAIILISKNSIDSRFINEEEIPKIIKRSQSKRGYKILPIVIDDVSIEDHKILKNIDLYNSQSTSLDTLTGRQYEFLIKDSIKEFSYIKKNINVKRILLSLLTLFSIYIVSSNTQDALSSDPLTVVDSNDYQDTNSLFNEDKFIRVITPEKVNENIGKATLISNSELSIIGKLVCEELNKGRPPFLIYNLATFKVRVLLNDLNLTGGEEGDVTPRNLNNLVNLIFYTANEDSCKQSVNTPLAEEKSYLLDYLSTYAVFRSEFYKTVYNEKIYNVFYKIDTNIDLDELDIATINLIDRQFNLFINGCEDDYSDTGKWLETMQSLISSSETLEDQNYHMDTFEIQFLYIPPIFCAEKIDDGSFLNTGFYFLEYNFDPVFTP